MITCPLNSWIPKEGPKFWDKGSTSQNFQNMQRNDTNTQKKSLIFKEFDATLLVAFHEPICNSFFQKFTSNPQLSI